MGSFQLSKYKTFASRGKVTVWFVHKPNGECNWVNRNGLIDFINRWKDVPLIRIHVDFGADLDWWSAQLTALQKSLIDSTLDGELS